MMKWSLRFVQGPHRSMLVDENVYAAAAPRANVSVWTVVRWACLVDGVENCALVTVDMALQSRAAATARGGAAHRGLSSELTLPLSYRLLQSNAMGALRETLAPELETSELTVALDKDATCGRRCGVAAGAVDGADDGRERQRLGATAFLRR
eukprot:gene18839-13580_t